MALAMVRPFKHPKTGTYWVRKVVPEALRALVGKRELKVTLGTKDPREAKAKAGPVIQRFEALLASANCGGIELSEREIGALCGEWYREQCTMWGDNPRAGGDWDIYLSILSDQLEDFEAWDVQQPAGKKSAADYGFDVEDGGFVYDDALQSTTGPSAHRPPVADGSVPEVEFRARRIFLTSNDRAEAAGLLEAHGHLADAATVTRLAEALFWTKRDFALEMQRRVGGDWSPDPVVLKFPALAPRVGRKAPEGAPKAITVEALITAWAAESGTNGKALYDRIRTGKGLTDHVGHTDATRITADDVVAWKEARLAAGRSTKTVANDIGEMRPIWTWGKANRKLTFDANPFAGLAPKTRKFARRVRGPYTEEEAARVLRAAREEADASLRWLPWVLCFSGARLGEVTQAIKEDVKRDGDVWFLAIHAEGDGRTLKTPQSERMVPLHPTSSQRASLITLPACRRVLHCSRTFARTPSAP
jgi:hypothetical protein